MTDKPENITRETLEAWLEVQEKSATHLANIASTLVRIESSEEKILNKLQNGLTAGIHEAAQHAKSAADSARGAEAYSRIAAWTIGSVCALIAIAEIVMHLIVKSHP